MIFHEVTTRSSNSQIYELWAPAHPITRENIWGSIPVEKIDYKQNNNVYPEGDEITPKTYETYQNFVTSPGYFGFHSPGSQHKLRPQLLDMFIAAFHLQHNHQTSQFCDNWQLWVNNNSSTRNQIFCKRMPAVMNHKGTFFDLSLLSLQVILAQWISVEI